MYLRSPPAQMQPAATQALLMHASRWYCTGNCEYCTKVEVLVKKRWMMCGDASDVLFDVSCLTRIVIAIQIIN